MNDIEQISNFISLPKKEFKISFQILTTTDCNLKCRYCAIGCDVIQNSYYLSYDKFKENLKDYIRIYNLCTSNIKSVIVLGSECFIHPKYKKFLKTLKLCFKGINVTTNGIKILDFKFNDLNNLSEILITVTNYPINIDYNKIYNFLSNCHLDIKSANYFKQICYDDKQHLNNEYIDKFSKDIYGEYCNNNYCDCNKIDSTKDYARFCPYFVDDKLFSCGVVAREYFLNNYKCIRATKENNYVGDYILLKDITNLETLLKFFQDTVFCHYCHRTIEDWSSINYKRI